MGIPDAELARRRGHLSTLLNVTVVVRTRECAGRRKERRVSKDRECRKTLFDTRSRATLSAINLRGWRRRSSDNLEILQSFFFVHEYPSKGIGCV